MSKKYMEVFSVTDTSIEGFFEEFRFLSNFHVHPVWYEGLLYGSTEAAYQAAKQVEPMRHMFQDVTPNESKKLNRKLELTSDDVWEFDKIKFDVMAQLQIEKFRDMKLRTLLLNTGTKLLEETNYWNDTYWGRCDGVGENKLGILLMHTRAYYRSFNKLGNGVV